MAMLGGRGRCPGWARVPGFHASEGRALTESDGKCWGMERAVRENRKCFSRGSEVPRLYPRSLCDLGRVTRILRLHFLIRNVGIRTPPGRA